jgi:hypothetical protein
VAILIDEYDAPILKYIENPDKADKFREALSDFYGVLKTNVTMIGHIFITGVSRFTKASLFSKLNNLDDITLDSNFATICGFTETDLEYLLGEYQDHLLDTFIKNGVMLPGSTPEYLKQLIHDWYDGYSWDGKTRVFNPWSLLHFFNKAKIFEYWYDSGTPTFLKELVDNGNVDFDLTKEIRDFNELKNNVDKISLIDPAVLMFQTGYLTINESLPTLDGPYNYSLRMPNLEVKGSFVPLMLSLQAPNDKMRTSKLAARTRDCLMTLDADGFEENFGGFLAQWNYDAHIEEEKYYQTLLEAALLMAGQRFWPQEHTAHGRLDIHIEGPKHEEYIIEIKLFREEKDSDGSSRTPPLKTDEITQLKEKMATLADDALMQISEKYAQKFLGDSRVVKIAVVVARRTFPFMQFQVVEKK